MISVSWEKGQTDKNNIFKSEKMKKGTTVLIVIASVAIITCFLYLVYKTWVVFGFWTLAWTGLVTTLSGTILGNLIGSRAESKGKITYNPKEWPKVLNIIICAFVGYYLFTIINVPSISETDFYFGLCYLILLTALPIIWATYKLFRDRNDFVEIDVEFISYKDNKKTGKFEILKIKKAEGLVNLTLHFKDETTHTIALSEMNFNVTDKVSLLNEINSRLPKTEETEQQ